MRKRPIAPVFAVVFVVGLVAGIVATSGFSILLTGFQNAPAGGNQAEKANETGRFSESSKNVFRIYGPDVYTTAIAVSQLVYPGPRTDAHPDAQPGVVILVPSGAGENPLYAEALPANALIHHPRNGPVLFTDPDRLNLDTANELRRLSPTGGPDWPQVFIVGRISSAVEDEVKRLGFRTDRLSGADPYETAALIDERMGRPGHVLIVRSDDLSHGLPGTAWIAHMGDSSLLFSESDRLPDATIRALQARQTPFAVHILGPEEYISAQVEEQLRGITGGQAVTRIAGENPFATAVAFARFKQGAFGWGIQNAGHGFYFTIPDRWQDAVAGALTAHLGGHGPLLFSTPERLPAETRDYLESVMPLFPADDPTQARFNRGYLISSPEVVGFDQQAEIDWLLESMSEMSMEGEPGMGDGMQNHR